MPGVNSLSVENGCQVFELGSGKYHLVSE
jgi:hypothetical protein